VDQVGFFTLDKKVVSGVAPASSLGHIAAVANIGSAIPSEHFKKFD